MDYLLKPVTRDELKATLGKIKADLDDKRKIRGDSELMQWRLSQYYREMKERFLLDLVKGNRLPPSSMPERLRLFHLESWQDQKVCFITASISQSDKPDIRKDRLHEQMHLPFEMVCYEIAQSDSDNVQVFHDLARRHHAFHSARWYAA